MFNDDLCLDIDSPVPGSSIMIAVCNDIEESQHWVYSEKVGVH